MRSRVQTVEVLKIDVDDRDDLDGTGVPFGGEIHPSHQLRDCSTAVIGSLHDRKSSARSNQSCVVRPSDSTSTRSSLP